MGNSKKVLWSHKTTCCSQSTALAWSRMCYWGVVEDFLCLVLSGSPISHTSFVTVPSPYVSVKLVFHYICLLKKTIKYQQWDEGKLETFSGSLHHFLCLTDALLPICSVWPTNLKEFPVPWNRWKNSINVFFFFFFHPYWWLFSVNFGQI